jgi:hypothetical protein
MSVKDDLERLGKILDERDIGLVSYGMEELRLAVLETTDEVGLDKLRRQVGRRKEVIIKLDHGLIPWDLVERLSPLTEAVRPGRIDLDKIMREVQKESGCTCPPQEWGPVPIPGTTAVTGTVTWTYKPCPLHPTRVTYNDH